MKRARLTQKQMIARMLKKYKGRYFSVRVDSTYSREKEHTYEVRLYIDPSISGEAASFTEALKKLEKSRRRVEP